MSYLLYILAICSWNHDFHMSKCEINYDTQDHALEIILHAFTDDLELAIEDRDSIKLRLYGEQEHEEADAILVDYLSGQLSCDIDGEPALWHFIGRESSEDLMSSLIYLEIPLSASPKEIYIDYPLLMSTYDDQKNLLQCRLDGKASGYELLQGKKHSYTWIVE